MSMVDVFPIVVVLGCFVVIGGKIVLNYILFKPTMIRSLEVMKDE